MLKGTKSQNPYGLPDTTGVVVDGVTYANKTTCQRVRGQRKSRAKRRAYLNKLKDGPCVDCGMQYPYYVMDFDHVRGEKTKPVSQLPMNKMDEEVKKCDLVCSNCHRERTQSRLRLS
jgi:hypothetical protein